MDNKAMRREAIRKRLTSRAGETPDARALAEAALATWHQVVVRLEPVIGPRGVDALFMRSLHLTSIVFPWLAGASENEDRSELLAGFMTCLATQETSVAAEASYVLLTTFADLLENLIGESLTERLLGPVWHPSAPVPEPRAAP